MPDEFFACVERSNAKSNLAVQSHTSHAYNEHVKKTFQVSAASRLRFNTMISKFEIQNYKALRNVILELTPVHVLIGPNDSGKTSILEAIAALCRSTDMELNRAFLGSWKGRELVWRSRNEASVVLAATFGDTTPPLAYSLECAFSPKERTATVANEMASDSPGTWKITFEGRNQLTQVCRVASRSQNPGPGKEALRSAANTIHERLSGVHFYRWVPRFLSLPVAPDASRRFRMDETGFGLALCLDDILGFDRERFTDLENRFKSVFPDIKSIKLIPEVAYRSPMDDLKPVPILQQADGKGIYFQFESNGELVPAAQVSDGVLLVLAYLAVLFLPEPPRVLLVEEPENGIHPARLKEVLLILRDVVKSQSYTQVVMTTHSPYVVDLFSPEEVTLCQKDTDGAISVRRLSESTAVRDQIDMFTLGEIWTSDGDEALMEATTAPAGGE